MGEAGKNKMSTKSVFNFAGKKIKMTKGLIFGKAVAAALCLTIMVGFRCSAQTDSCGIDEIAVRDSSSRSFKPRKLIIPGTLIGLGATGLGCDLAKRLNVNIQTKLQERVGGRIPVDDFTQYAPVAALYGLKVCGVRSRHGYGEMTIILGTAYSIMGLTVSATKSATGMMRPDGSTRNSLPSGHTATAFMGAELLRREYRDVSPWIGVAGYSVAAFTGFMRMYNNRHWLTDVVAGAGVGILSAEAAYWLYPTLRKVFYRSTSLRNTHVSQFVSGQFKGLVCTVNF